MKCFNLILSIILFAIPAFAQKSLSDQDEFIRKKSIYFNFTNTAKPTLAYFTKGEFADQEPIIKKYQFSLKNRFCNLYFNWLNPLRYEIKWKDSVYNDSREVDTKNFMTLLVAQYGSAATNLNKNVQDKSLRFTVKSIGNTQLYPINDPGFNSLQLLNLYINIRDIVDKQLIAETELNDLNKILATVQQLDGEVATNIPDSVSTSLSNLFNVDDYKNVKAACDTEDARVKRCSNSEKIKSNYNKLKDMLKEFKIEKDPIFTQVIKKTISEFSSTAASNADKNAALLSGLSKSINQLRNSVKNIESPDNPGFFLNRNVQFDVGKVLETAITITEYSYDKDKQTFTAKPNPFQASLIFRKSDVFIVSVSAGIFYSNATLKSFGVGNNSSGQQVVTSDNISKNTAVTATFLNLTLNIDSRIFDPLLQLGIDPTKKRPYTLLGGGFYVPAAQFALTGGLLWTWDAALTKLSVGDVVKSTTDLEKDITHKFDSSPKGFYVGVQYNF